MTPSEQCKKAGLKSLSELVELSGIPTQTLRDWHREKPERFAFIINGALYKKGNGNGSNN